MGEIAGPQRLESSHETSSFACREGAESFATWLRQHALVQQKIGTSVTHVLCRGVEVRGYYSLACTSVTSRKLGSGASPAIMLGKLARSAEEDRGLGSQLLSHALRTCLAVSQKIGARAVVLDPIAPKVGEWYRLRGFKTLDGDRLFMKLSQVRSATIAP